MFVLPQPVFFPLCLAGMINRAGREVSISCMSVAPEILISISLRHYIIISFSVSCLLFLAHACLIKTPPAKFIFFFSPLTHVFFFHHTVGKSITYTNLHKVYQSNLACNYCIIQLYQAVTEQVYVKIIACHSRKFFKLTIESCNYHYRFFFQ